MIDTINSKCYKFFSFKYPLLLLLSIYFRIIISQSYFNLTFKILIFFQYNFIKRNHMYIMLFFFFVIIHLASKIKVYLDRIRDKTTIRLIDKILIKSIRKFLVSFLLYLVYSLFVYLIFDIAFFYILLFFFVLIFKKIWMNEQYFNKVITKSNRLLFSNIIYYIFSF